MEMEVRHTVGSIGSIDLSRGGNPTAAVDLTGQVHQLPCCVKYDGPCSVSHYFKPKPTGMDVEGLKMEEAYFRGRKLQGTTFPLPQGYSEISAELQRERQKNAELIERTSILEAQIQKRDMDKVTIPVQRKEASRNSRAKRQNLVAKKLKMETTKPFRQGMTLDACHQEKQI
ncbi:hypothetical protein LOK49_LG05G02509 [Camellia lanceoleosa]|uniref:Uncharacterized protein n=2 Tax=Camellia lanceoleosa TaxID=1840588 RepID=A0ACC0HRF4_9ERIC|nr:hypothetical protein LOK49_LG15G00513 [Camellia lanceoleosa]KAI8015634.1 hypothetical protein LOK49_LG05G02509 [Camellia lanceoleosa]